MEESLGHFDVTPERRTTQRLRALASVCRQWKYALDQGPSVWGWIDHPGDASFAAHKSGNAPLSINFGKEGYLESTELECGLAALRPHSKRWRFLHICMTFSAARHVVEVVGSLSAPGLEDLGFFVDSSNHSGTLKLPYLDRYHLRSLALGGTSTSWETVASLRGLRSLMIARLGSAAPSREQIGGILLGCPRLEELTLSNLENHPPDFSLPPLVPPIFSLPALRSVALIKVISTREVAFWLLECITAPNLIGLAVMGNRMNRDIGHPIVNMLKRQRTDSLLPVVMASLGLRQVCVYITQYGCQIECAHEVRRGAHRGVKIYLPGVTYAEGWQAFVDLVSCALGNLPLNVEIDKLGGFRVGSPDPDPSSLSQLPSLSVLRLGYFVSNVEAFLHYLSSDIPGNPTKYPCPNLKEVHLRIVSRPEAELQRHAINSLMDKRPDLALYEDTRRLSRYSE